MNEVVLIGRLTRDPEIRYTNNQTAVCTFTLAVDRPRRRDQNQNPDAPTADFIRITVWGRQGETCSRYLSKGRQAAVQGRIQTGSYVNNEGRRVYTTDVVANRVEFLGSRGDNQGYGQNQGGYSQNYGGGGYGNQGGQDSYGGQGGYQNNGYQQPSGQAPQNGDQQNDDLPEGFQTIDEDDIPF